MIVLPVPYRHDLQENSCVNVEIENHNRKMRKICKWYPHASLAEPGLDRSHFTKHGQHCNIKGKMAVSQTLCDLVTKLANASVQEVVIPCSYTNYVDSSLAKNSDFLGL